MVTFLLVLALLLSECAMFGNLSGRSAQRAMALSNDYAGRSYMIYYFTDFYPTFNEEELLSDFPTYSVYMDRWDVDEAGFKKLVNADYFSGFGSDCVVIIDIKTFEPDLSLLATLFYKLKTNYSCKTILVSQYDESDVASSAIDEYLDLYVQDAEFATLWNFLYRSLYHDGLTNIACLIDGKLIDVQEYIEVEADVDTMCDSSIFLRMLLEVMALDDFYNIASTDYQEIANKLRSTYHVVLLVHLTGNKFVDILTWTTYEFNEYDDILSIDVKDGEGPLIEWVCALGFWNLQNDFYQFLDYMQSGDWDQLPLYALIVNAPVYEEGALKVTFNSSFENTSGCKPENARAALSNGLHKLLD